MNAMRPLVGMFILACLVSGGQLALGNDPNSLSSEEEKLGFELLFNGQDLDGWKHAGNWKVEDGAISYQGRGGSLVYQNRTIPDDFELRFQWRVAQGSNSGIYYRPGQYEYQILDNHVHADGKNPRTSAASLYFCMAPSRDATKPVMQWNSGRVICKGTVIQHWLNGEKVIDFDYADPKWEFNVDLLTKRSGRDLSGRGASLMVQDHGNPVWYRSIKLRELNASDELDTTPITPAEISADVLEAEKKKLEAILQRRQRAAKRKS